MKNVNISNCNFATKTEWDKDVTESILYTAKALYNMTEFFKSNNIKIDALLKVVIEKEEESGK